MPTTLQDAVQDKEFLAAPVTQQISYLASIDPEFKGAKAEDQLSYLNEISGRPAPTTAKNSVELGEAPALPNKASLWEKAKAIPAAVAPDANTHPLDALGRMASGAWSGLKAMNPLAGAPTNPEEAKQFVAAQVHDLPYKALGPAGGLAKGAVEGYQGARSEGSGVIPSVGAGLANMFGLDTPGIRQRASAGDVAGVIGEGIPAVAATLLGPETHRLPDVKEGIARIARTPEGDLRPMVEKGAKVAGAAAGHVLGPVGSIAGYEAGPRVLDKLLPNRMPAVEPAVAPKPVVSSEPYSLTAPNVEPEAAIQSKMEFPTVEGTAATPGPTSTGMPAVQPGRVGPPLQRLGDLIEAGAGTKPLEPAVSLRDQLPANVGAAAAGFTPATDTMQNAGGKVTFRREPIIKTVGGLEEGPLRANAPEKMPAVLGNEVQRSMGVEPEAADAEKQRLQTKYPDRETRQLVHANGEDMVDAVGNDRETLKAIHDLKNPDVRQAAINLGESMVREDGSPIMINNRMLSGDITRQQMFKKLLSKGYTPKEIIAASKAEMEPAGGKPGLMRAPTLTPAKEKTGD
jgi:hypothetical protein